MRILPIIAIGLSLTIAACSSRPDGPEALNPYTDNGSSFDSSLLENVSPGSRGHLSRAQLEMRQAVEDTVRFDTDSSSVSPDAGRILAAQAEWLKRNTQYSIVIEGHADERGARTYNLALGARRADAVRDYLISRGVPSNRIETMSWGKEAPLETCSAERCWSVNRRAVTMVR